MDIIKLLKKIPLFSSLKESELRKIQQLCIRRNYKKGQSIVLEDDPSINTMFIIVSGKVKVSVFGMLGKEAILAILKDGDFFGEMAIIDGEPRSASCFALEDTELLMIRRGDFLEQISNNPRLALPLLIEFSRRLRKANRQITNLSLLSVYGRVASVILQLAKERGEPMGKAMMITNRPTHQEIADMAGTTRETVTRVLSKFQKGGTIVVDKQNIIIMREDILKSEEN